MLRENKYFQGVLTKIASKAKDEDVILTFNIRHQMEGEVQNFLLSYAERCSQSNIRELFYTPVQWKKINFETAYKFRLWFGDLDCFFAILREIKVSRSFKSGSEIFTYDLTFEKEVEKDIDPLFASFLNQKEFDENGRKKTILFDVNLEPIEILERK